MFYADFFYIGLAVRLARMRSVMLPAETFETMKRILTLSLAKPRYIVEEIFFLEGGGGRRKRLFYLMDTCISLLM